MHEFTSWTGESVRTGDVSILYGDAAYAIAYKCFERKQLDDLQEKLPSLVHDLRLLAKRFDWKAASARVSYFDYVAEVLDFRSFP